ncbi:hypothetical protein Trydic_g10921 [Trypoxylus dichotomus]
MISTLNLKEAARGGWMVDNGANSPSDGPNANAPHLIYGIYQKTERGHATPRRRRTRRRRTETEPHRTDN